MRDMDNEVMMPDLPDLPLGGEEKAALLTRLWQLLIEQTGRYTMGDSSSVRVETAEELFRSVCFTVNLCVKEGLYSYREIAGAEDPGLLMKRGYALIEEKVSKGRELLKKVMDNPPGMDNISYSYTVKGIETFFKRYDPLFFSHKVPADIDYQLCIPVPESLMGIEYINEYLRRLLFENLFLCKFDRAPAVSLLSCLYLGFWQLPVNLFEPVATNAVGLALLKKDPIGLDINREDEARLTKMFSSSDRGSAVKLLEGAAESAAAALGFVRPEQEDYLARFAIGLWPRIKSALPGGSLSGIFLNLP